MIAFGMLMAISTEKPVTRAMRWATHWGWQAAY